VSIEIVIALHLAATLFMVGVIWFVQIVHYPLFALVSPEAYPSYERQHQRLTTFVVAPAMLIELFSGAWIAYAIPAYRNDPLFGIAGALLIVIWLSTFLLQVPCHQMLCEKFSAQVHRRLVLSNWARTVAWTFRGIAVVVLIFYL